MSQLTFHLRSDAPRKFFESGWLAELNRRIPGVRFGHVGSRNLGHSAEDELEHKHGSVLLAVPSKKHVAVLSTLILL